MEKERLDIEIMEHKGIQKGTLAWFKGCVESGDITFHDYIQGAQQILIMNINNHEFALARGCTITEFTVVYETISYTTKTVDEVIKEIAQKWCDLRNYEKSVSIEEVPNIEIYIISEE